MIIIRFLRDYSCVKDHEAKILPKKHEFALFIRISL